jgi:cytochrome c oxidase subunit 2
MVWRPGTRAATIPGLCALAIGGCGDQSTLDPQSEPARRIAGLFWWMLGAGALAVLGTVALLLASYVRRHRPGLPHVQSDQRATGLVVMCGILVPLVALVAVFVVANFSVANITKPPTPGSAAMTIVVTGHQWWWEVSYPGTPAVSANEIHIPAGTRVDAELRSADVMHSFWVPTLNRKADMLPGHPNSVLLYADHPGTYRGQCSEFCGMQHANMALKVVADPPARFRAWLRDQAAPARTPATAEQRTGERAFEADQCASCHTIRGTGARGGIGPDLTHLADRTTLAALTIPNTPAQLRRWISDPQHAKPGNRMPGLALSDRSRDALVAYLDSLR